MSQTGYYLAKIAASYMNHTIDGFAMCLFCACAVVRQCFDGYCWFEITFLTGTDCSIVGYTSRLRAI